MEYLQGSHCGFRTCFQMGRSTQNAYHRMEKWSGKFRCRSARSSKDHRAPWSSAILPDSIVGEFLEPFLASWLPRHM